MLALVLSQLSRLRWSLAVLLILPLGAGWGESKVVAQSINVENVLVRLIEQVDVPAKEPGVLADVRVREGEMVEAGDLLAQIEDNQARLAQTQAKLELDIAERKASNDVSVRYARKALEVAKAELKRSQESAQKFNKAVSKTELDRLQLTVERGLLEIENAEHALEVEKFTQYLRRSEVELAEENLDRMRVVAPIAGFVDQISRRKGEWVEPGQKVVRILRIDRLRAEAFIAAEIGISDLVGRPVELSVRGPADDAKSYAGKLVYVSPEIDPVNRQVRVWAEIKNHDLKLRPGQRATMRIAD